jgi:hypothetical protein
MAKAVRTAVRPRLRRCAWLVVVALLSTAAWAAGAGVAPLRADPIPQNVLDNSHKSCLQNCVTAGPSTARCTAYCNCTVDSIEEEFTGEEFMAMNTASATNQSIDPVSSSKLTQIVNTCRAKTLP